MELHSQTFLDNASEALKDTPRAQRRDLLALFTPLVRDAAVDKFEHFEATRRHVKRIREHALDNLDYYLGQFEQEAVHNGNRVHFATDGEELNSIVLDICQQHGARRIAKGKSMVTEETGLNDFLLRAGLEVMETDLGEFIIQLAGEPPSHIIVPAVHKNKDQIAKTFHEKIPGAPYTPYSGRIFKKSQ